MTESAPRPEFSRFVALGDFPAAGERLNLEADEGQRAALAKRFDVIRINILSGAMSISATQKRIDITGRLEAQLIRRCVVTLDEMVERIDEPLELAFVRDADLLDEDDETGAGPELHQGAEIDVGELLAQQLSLAMAPFPREEGATLDSDHAVAVETSPFAAIAGKFSKIEQNH
ncbi:MAG: hypothetical protein AAGC77_10050 [Pseudomonadota bacterium]